MTPMHPLDPLSAAEIEHAWNILNPGLDVPAPAPHCCAHEEVRR